jgi:nonsense-mediated mRNA decay protein 3
VVRRSMEEKRAERKRAKWTKFCPKCGKQTDIFFDSVCEDCFREGITLLEPENLEISLGVCKHCGSYFKGREQTSIEAAVEESVRKELRKKFGLGCEVEIAELRKEIEEEGRRARVFLVVRAEIEGLELEERAEVAVILKRETCERCSRIAGGYYAGIVQIRADGRIPTDDELAIAEEIAYSSLDEADFVSKEQMLREGLDIYVSSIECGRRISRGIVRHLGGGFSESRKLYGRKDGKDIYRVSFSVRLPGFKEGEAVSLDDRVISVEKVIEGKGIMGVDTKTGEPLFLSKKEMMRARRI